MSCIFPFPSIPFDDPKASLLESCFRLLCTPPFQPFSEIPRLKAQGLTDIAEGEDPIVVCVDPFLSFTEVNFIST